MKEEILAKKKTCDTATGNKSISQKKKMFKHYEQKTWKTNAHKIKLFICMILPWKLYMLNVFIYYVFCNGILYILLFIFMFHYILFNSLFYFSWFSLLQQISYAAKMLPAKMLMEKVQEPKHWYLRSVTPGIITYPYQRRDPIIAKVTKSQVLSFWTALIFNRIWSVHLSQH